MRFRMCCIALLMFSGIGTATAGPPILVKEHGDLSRLVVEGNKSFAADDIREALDQNLELLALRRRLAPYREFEEALKRLIRDGYLHAGFSHVAVSVTYDDERDAIVATILEGTRYNYGSIEVTGVVDDLASLIQRRLTRPNIPVDEVVDGVRDVETGDLLFGIKASGEPVEETAPAWKPGKPADFQRFAVDQFRKPAIQALRDAGFEGAEVDVQLIPSVDDEVAVLHVDVTDVGAPIIIDELVITGAERNSTEAVLKFLGIQTPVPWTPDLRRTLNQSLWDCGRFQGFSVKVDAPEDVGDGDPTRLHLNLIEFDGAPLLTEELSEVDQILCRAAHWLSTEACRRCDLVVEGHDNRDNKEPQAGSAFNISRLHAVMSAEHGLFSDVEWMSPGNQNPHSFLLALEPDRWLARSGLNGQCLEFRFERAIQVKLDLALVGVPDRESDKHVSMRFGFGFSSSHSGVRVQLAATPMAMLYQARFDDPACSISNGVLSIRSDSLAAEFEAATGRWIRFALLNREIEAGSVEIRFEEQAFERAMRRCRDRLGNGAVVESIPRFIAGQLIAIVSESGAADAESLITLTAFSTRLTERLADRIEGTRGANRAESFYIPWIPTKPLAVPTDIVGIVLGGNALLFPRESPFGTFGRELLLGFVMQDEQASSNIERLMESYSTGPLMYWYAAEIFRYLNPVAAQAIAREGQDRLDRRRFESDCRQLLTRDDIAKDVIEDCVASLRELDDNQLDALFSLVAPTEQRSAMIAALYDDGSSDLDVLLSLLGELWDAKLRDLLWQRLITLGGGLDIRNARRERAPGDSIRATALAP